MSRSGHELRQGADRHNGRPATDRAIGALERVAADGGTVVVLGFDGAPNDAWAVLSAAGVRVVHATDVVEATDLLAAQAAHVVVADVPQGRTLLRAIRRRDDLAGAHVVLCAALDSPRELRAALDAGADDVMRVPFEPEVLAARVGAGFRAARLRANEALLRSLVANIPGALYRCACDANWTMEWLSDEIEGICGHPASDFIDSRVRTFASVIHPDDRELVERSVLDGVEAGRPYTIEYRMVHRDGGVRWVLERGQGQEAGDGRRWLDGAIFDVTARRAAEEALRQHQVVEAQLAEVRASRARILDAADRARREIERNLHDGAQQRFVSIALRLQLFLSADGNLPDDARTELTDVLAELRSGLAELRDLAQGLHPAVLSERGLEHAVRALVNRAAVPVELDVALDAGRLTPAVESAAYFTVCEALTNVAKYAEATYAWVHVRRRDGSVEVEIGDDGIGGVDVRRGSGIEGLRDRIASVGGTLEITSRPRSGTVVRACLPVAGA